MYFSVSRELRGLRYAHRVMRVEMINMDPAAVLRESSTAHRELPSELHRATESESIGLHYHFVPSPRYSLGDAIRKSPPSPMAIFHPNQFQFGSSRFEITDCDLIGSDLDRGVGSPAIKIVRADVDRYHNVALDIEYRSQIRFDIRRVDRSVEAG